MRAGIVAIFFFAALLALGHYVAAPFFCRGELAIPTLDPRALCGADAHFNRSGSVLLYFASIAGALFFGIVAALIPARAKTPPKEKTETDPAETFEQIIAAEEKKLQNAPTSAAEPAPAPAAAPEPEKTAAAPEETKPAAADKTAGEDKPAPDSEKKPETPAVAAVAAVPAIEAEPAADPDPATISAAEAITVGLAVTKSASRGPFDGSNEELLERFRELRKNEGVNSIAQAQRLLDESTMSALAKGVDPKQHLSQVAHLVLTEDPDLKSAVVRGVVVHVAARLKELGVAKPNLPGAAKGAA